MGNVFDRVKDTTGGSPPGDAGGRLPPMGWLLDTGIYLATAEKHSFLFDKNNLLDRWAHETRTGCVQKNFLHTYYNRYGKMDRCSKA